MLTQAHVANAPPCIFAVGQCMMNLQLQVASPEDTSNFDSTNTEAGWVGIDKRHRYESTGAFKDF